MVDGQGRVRFICLEAVMWVVLPLRRVPDVRAVGGKCCHCAKKAF